MSQPTIIQGPAFVSYNSYVYYVKGNVTVRYRRKTWNPEVANFGKLGVRMISQMVEVEFTPSGQYTAATAVKYWPHAATAVGTSIFTASPLPLVIIPLAGNKVTFHRAGILTPPPLKLSAIATMWGSMKFVALGLLSVEPTNAAAFQTIAATSTDTSFDPATVLSPRYALTWGTNFVAAEPDDAGFDAECILETKEMSIANYGVIDLIIQSLGTRLKFKPVGYTEAQIATAMLLQDAAALLPGAVIGTADDAVIAGTGVSVTLRDMGITDAELVYGVGEFRQGEVTLENKLTFATGAPSTLWTFA